MEPGRTLLLALALAMAAQAEGSPPLSYSAKPVHGTVVDAATGQALEGVIVLAQWILDEPGLGSWRRLHVFETTTEAAGNYFIPGWGPIRNTGHPWTRLRDKDPLLVLFKQGYQPQALRNDWDHDLAVRFSEWDGKTIKLEKLRAPDEQLLFLILLQPLVVGGADVLDWRLAPRLVFALEQERLKLAQKHLGAPDPLSILNPLPILGTTAEEVRRFLEAQK